MLEALAAIVKTLLYAGLLSCAGAVFASTTLRITDNIARVATQIMCRSALLTIAASAVGALILFLRLGRQWDQATLSAVFMSSSGAATFMQLAGAGLLLASAGDTSANTLRISNAALMTLSFAFSGHAAAMDLVDGVVAFIHASAAAWWIGSLWLLRYACMQTDIGFIVNVVQRFSAIATRLIGGLVIAGLVLIAALVEFKELPALSSYEQILAVKIGVVVLVLGIASYNKFQLTPRLAIDSTAVSSLSRMINFELALIGVILLVTAILTTYTSPHD